MFDIGPGTADVEHVTAVPLAGRHQVMQGHNMGVPGKFLPSKNVNQQRAWGPHNGDVQKQRAMSSPLLLWPVYLPSKSFLFPNSILSLSIEKACISLQCPFSPLPIKLVFKPQMLTISLSLTLLQIPAYEMNKYLSFLLLVCFLSRWV